MSEPMKCTICLDVDFFESRVNVGPIEFNPQLVDGDGLFGLGKGVWIFLYPSRSSMAVGSETP